MNILVPDSWLREHLKTKAKVAQIAEYLSLCSQSVEKTTKVGDDWVYEIEVTTNRPDCLSVLGIARELAAILPRFGTKAKLKEVSSIKYQVLSIKKGLPLEVKIKNLSLCPRFTALIFDDVNIKPSPKIVQERLEKSGIRALNNVVDISNYLMLELGQPMHTFDYDKIGGAKMILRESAGGEKITTLDGQTRPLPDGAIIIQDDEGRIIDLCGIMGGENSAVDEKTKRVLLFIQTYDPMKIRRTCQLLSFRTEAAQRFEKGVDPQGVILSMEKAIAMFEKNCGAKVASKLIDIYPNSPKQKTIKLDLGLVKKIMGIEIPKNEVVDILRSLGFSILHSPFSILHFSVPHWRDNDIAIPEDLIEEIARIYGYHNLPSLLPTGEIPQQKKSFTFVWENKVKEALKFWGFSETFNYSMVSESTLVKAEINPAECLKIANPLSEDWIFMRPSLIPSLLEVVTKNQAQTSEIQIFELANVYIPTTSDKLPDEIPMLSGALTGNQFFQAKGIIEALLAELGITHYNFTSYQLKKTFYGKIFHPFRTAEITIGQDSLGIVGEINPIILARFGIKGRVVVFDLDFNELVKYATTTKKYTPVPKYPAIIEDLAFVVPEKTLVGEMIQLIKSTSLIIQSVELLDSYKETRTFRIAYQSEKKTLSDKEVEKIRKGIIKLAEKKFGAKIKG